MKLLITLASLAALGCGPQRYACACEPEAASSLSGWCESCNSGYVASRRIESRMLFDALDAHGHDIEEAGLQCASCRELREAGGYCEACRFGWVDHQAYMSRLTYQLARGTTVDRRSSACSGCRRLGATVGQCGACGGGWTGNVFFTDPAVYEQAAFEFARLEAANQAAERCETCALVLLVDGTCPYCRIAYVDGHALEPLPR